MVPAAAAVPADIPIAVVSIAAVVRAAVVSASRSSAFPFAIVVLTATATAAVVFIVVVVVIVLFTVGSGGRGAETIQRHLEYATVRRGMVERSAAQYESARFSTVSLDRISRSPSRPREFSFSLINRIMRINTHINSLLL